MRLLVDEMPYYKDDCLFAKSKWRDEEETWVSYCKLTDVRCDLDEEKCSYLKAMADRKTEPKPCEWCKFYNGENCCSQEPCKVMLYFKDEPQTEREGER